MIDRLGDVLCDFLGVVCESITDFGSFSLPFEICVSPDRLQVASVRIDLMRFWRNKSTPYLISILKPVFSTLYLGVLQPVRRHPHKRLRHPRHRDVQETGEIDAACSVAHSPR